MSVVAIIPARSGSKGVPNKNIKELCQYPLISYSIKLALKSKYINKVLLSTDSEEYKQIGLKFGAEVPFLRPKEISGDKSTDTELFCHLLKWYQQSKIKIPDFFVHLRPTTPLRKVEIVDEAIKKIMSNKSCTALRSVHEMSETAYKTLEIQNDDFLCSTFSRDRFLDKYNNSRQEYPKTYSANGYVDVLKTSFILKEGKIHGDKVLSFVTDPALEVDTFFDFELLEMLANKNENKKIIDELFGGPDEQLFL